MNRPEELEKIVASWPALSPLQIEKLRAEVAPR